MTDHWRYTPLAALTAMAVLLAAAVAIVVLAERGYTEDAIQDARADAQVLGHLMTAPLAAGDTGTLTNYLAALEADRGIVAAAVYDARGRRTATFVRAGAEPAPDTATQASIRHEGDRIAVAVPVLQDDRLLGTVYVRVVAETFVDRIARYGDLLPLGVMMLVVLAVLGIAQATVNRANAELKRRADALQRSNTELLAQIEQRQTAEEALRQAQKMESIGHLTGGVAHDFNNLLAIMVGSLNLLQDRGGDERQEKLLAAALRAARRGGELTQRLLAFSRRQALQPQPVDVNRLIARMSDPLTRTLGERIAVKSVAAADLWRTHVDPNQLEAAIMNLSANARDAMPDGGTLTIETANAHLDERYADRHDDVRVGDYVRLGITDTGVGMTPQVAERAFEPFFTTKDVGHGTGLGLSQVYGLVKQSGGHIAIDSERGRGTTVRIYLPRLVSDDAPATPGAVPVPPPGPAADARGVILVVEDNDSMREHSVTALEELGYRVLQAADGAQALRALDEHPEIELLFTDIGLPGGMNGRELAAAAQARRPEIKMLFTTGYTRDAIAGDERLDATVRLIAKPFTYDELAGGVRDLLADEPPAVLVVEDEFLVMMNIVDCLDELGIRAIEAGTAAEARQSLERSDGDGIACVILDLNLPDLRGDGLAAEIRERWPALPVVVSSGFGREELRPGLQADPTVGYLPKPFEPSELKSVLTRAGMSLVPGRG